MSAMVRAFRDIGDGAAMCGVPLKKAASPRPFEIAHMQQHPSIDLIAFSEDSRCASEACREAAS